MIALVVCMKLGLQSETTGRRMSLNKMSIILPLTALRYTSAISHHYMIRSGYMTVDVCETCDLH